MKLFWKHYYETYPNDRCKWAILKCKYNDIYVASVPKIKDLISYSYIYVIPKMYILPEEV